MVGKVITILLFFLMIRRPPRSTPFPTRRSSDLTCAALADYLGLKELRSVQRYESGERSISDRKSTRLISSHDQISYAVFCLKKKKRDAAVRPYQYHHQGGTRQAEHAPAA